LTRKGKGTKWMLVTDGNGLPLGFVVDSAQKAEVTLAVPTLATVRVAGKAGRPKTRPGVLMADRAYDSGAFRQATPSAGSSIAGAGDRRVHSASAAAKEVEAEAGSACELRQSCLWAAVQGGAYLRMAGQLPQVVDPLGASSGRVPRLLHLRHYACLHQ